MKLKTKTKRRVDKKFSQYIRKRDGKCLRCGTTDKQLQCSHIIPRQITHLRWSADNAISLCCQCHKFGKNSWHSNPLMSVRWLEQVLPTEQISNLVTLGCQHVDVTEEDILIIEKELDEK